MVEGNRDRYGTREQGTYPGSKGQFPDRGIDKSQVGENSFQKGIKLEARQIVANNLNEKQLTESDNIFQEGINQIPVTCTGSGEHWNIFLKGI